MTAVLRFEVPGEPVAKGRPRVRVVPNAGKPFASLYTPAETAAYEKTVATFCQIAVNQARWAWAEKDRFVLVARVFRTHEGVGGDLDNVIKALGDSMNGIAFADDRYVRGIVATLHQDPARPRVEIEVRRVQGPTKKAKRG